MYWSPAELKLDDATIFPTLEAKSAVMLWVSSIKNFLDKAAAPALRFTKTQTKKSGSVFIENLMLLMQVLTYGACLASYASLPDVSLYDQAAA